jgi:putative MATE family efflux protein
MNAASPSPLRSLFRAELGATMRLAAPLAAANLLQMAVYAIDVIFVARLGPEALAAASLAVAIFSLINFGFIGVTGAVAPLVAAELGRKAHAVREVRRSVRMALWLAVLGGAVGMGLCQFGEPFMRLTGQEAATSQRAGWFLAILSLSLIPMLVANVLRTFVSALGRPIFATLITALAIGVNALGNWALVFGNLGMPALGLLGSALSTLITALATVAAYALAIRHDRRLRRYRVFGRWWRPEWQRMAEILRLGVPIALTVIAEGGLFSSAAFLMGRIGEIQLAAHTVALQVAAFFFQVPFGVGQAATIRVGYHRGPGRLGGAAHRRGLRRAFGRRDTAVPDAVRFDLRRCRRARQRRAGRLRCPVSVHRRRVPAVRRRPGSCRRRSTRAAGHARADGHRDLRLLAAGLRHRAGAGLRHRPQRNRGVDGTGGGPHRRRRRAGLAVAPARSPGPVAGPRAKP